MNETLLIGVGGVLFLAVMLAVSKDSASITLPLTNPEFAHVINTSISGY